MKPGYLIMLCLLLTACRPSPNQLTATAVITQAQTQTTAPTQPPTHTPTSASTVTATLTLTPTRTNTPTPKPTDTPEPTLTPSPTLGPPVTSTLAPAAECPAGSGASAPAIRNSTIEDFETDIAAFLDAVGSSEGLLSALNRSIGPYSSYTKFKVHVQDLNWDTTPDILVDITGDADSAGTFVFWCSAGRFESAPLQFFYFDYLPRDFAVLSIRDMNANGVPEIVLAYDEFRFGIDIEQEYLIFEWDGSEFSLLLLDSTVNGYGRLSDLDGDGAVEFLTTSGGARSPDAWPGSNTLYRPATKTWTWTGYDFELVCVDSSPPVFRIHAVYDGDWATRCGHYDKALAFYQAAIFDEKLLGWGWDYDEDDQGNQQRIVDPEERPRLSAYARYRIMLLHIIQGNLNEARIVYDTLQSKFPVGAVGHPYAELANEFWNEYNTGNDIAAACGKAIDYASTNEKDILWPISGFNGFYGDIINGFYGDSNRDYTPEDICPFK